MAVYDREEDAPQVNLYGRKMKLLEVMRILERETDAEHALTANRIAARLEEKGFPHADRKRITIIFEPMENASELMRILSEKIGARSAEIGVTFVVRAKDNK